jgi:iron(III) transport system ATP-binding protein
MVISDRIIVMNRGRIEQQGDARAIYTRPANRFVAEFIGMANLFSAKVMDVDADGSLRADVSLGSGRATLRGVPTGAHAAPGTAVSVLIRPEDVEVAPAGGARHANTLEGTVVSAVYMGSYVEYHVDVGGSRMRVHAGAGAPYRHGDRVALGFPPASCLCIADDGAIG